ncbi:BatD family protein [Thaumasiovibrio sp. DFM-14]|uniref:BatD family protein n=1 Tax=Thaumasiovibrio sp. DFM-14 TaxID=3384792 RepID=UPI0039A3B720
MKRTLLLILCLLVPSAAFSEEKSAIATVSTNLVALNEPFQLTITVNDSVNPRSLDLSPLADGFATGALQQGSRSYNNNGHVTRQTTVSLPVAVIDETVTEIPPLTIAGLTTQAIALDVRANIEDANRDQHDVQLNTHIEATSLYPQQSTLYTVQLLIAVPIENYTIIPPHGEGVSVEQYGEDKQYTTTVNGRNVVIFERQYRLTPSQTGITHLQGAQLKGDIIRTARRGFGSSVAFPVERQGETVELTVHPIPESYEGVWLPTPSLTLAQDWLPETQTLASGDALTREIQLSIAGVSPADFPAIVINYPNSVSVYDERPSYTTDNGVTTMSLKQVIIPRQSGELTLPGLSVNWWNSDTHQQETASLAPFTLTVTPSLIAKDESDIAEVDLPIANNTIVEVNDPGIWPLLTSLFATLWLLTLGIWWKTHRLHRAVSQHPQLANTALDTTFAAALKSGDSMKIQRAWSTCPAHIRQHCQPAMQAYLASIYGKQSNNSTDTLTALQTAYQTTPNNVPQEEALAPLVP